MGVLKKNNNILIVNGPLNMKYFYMSNFTININIEKKFITVYFNNSNTKNEQELQKKEFVFFTKFLKNISKLYKKNLTIKGFGYNSSILNLKNNTILILKLGFSHLIYVKIPKNLKVNCITKNKIQIIGAAKEKVSQFAKLIKSYKKPEPYKG